MVFSSAIFLFFFLPLVLLIYYSIKIEYRNTFLLFASLVFYAWDQPKFAFVIILSILINYIFGFLIHLSQQACKNIVTKMTLLTGITINCGLLFYFKYYNFFITSIVSITGFDIPLKNIVLLIGISFFTFQGVSYLIDVYLNKVDAQKNLMKFALFKAFFPQLIAGPIVRYIDVHDQINQRTCTIDKFAEGVKRFVMGLGKKVIIANTLGVVADGIFGLPYYQNSVATAWLGAICYAFQIYFDFSGYSDMAIGLAKMFGFDFKENFNYPYISKTMTEFWRRWHISLSTWFKDYLYIPLGGNRTGNVYMNLLIVFLITGLWHGAAWNFIIWGLWHGLFLIIERILKTINYINIALPKSITWMYTTLVFLIGWVFFRSPDLNYAMNYLKIMFGILNPYDIGFSVWYYLDPMAITMLILACIGSTPIYKYTIERLDAHRKSAILSRSVQTGYLFILLILCIMFVSTSTYNPFIYFRF